MTKQIFQTVALLILGIFIGMWFMRLDAAPNHDQCVTYWTDRTATWVNPPSIEHIHNNASYCGNV